LRLQEASVGIIASPASWIEESIFIFILVMETNLWLSLVFAALALEVILTD